MSSSFNSVTQFFNSGQYLNTFGLDGTSSWFGFATRQDLRIQEFDRFHQMQQEQQREYQRREEQLRENQRRMLEIQEQQYRELQYRQEQDREKQRRAEEQREQERRYREKAEQRNREMDRQTMELLRLDTERKEAERKRTLIEREEAAKKAYQVTITNEAKEISRSAAAEQREVERGRDKLLAGKVDDTTALMHQAVHYTVMKLQEQIDE